MYDDDRVSVRLTNYVDTPTMREWIGSDSRIEEYVVQPDPAHAGSFIFLKPEDKENGQVRWTPTSKTGDQMLVERLKKLIEWGTLEGKEGDSGMYGRNDFLQKHPHFASFLPKSIFPGRGGDRAADTQKLMEFWAVRNAPEALKFLDNSNIGLDGHLLREPSDMLTLHKPAVVVPKQSR